MMLALDLIIYLMMTPFQWCVCVSRVLACSVIYHRGRIYICPKTLPKTKPFLPKSIYSISQCLSSCGCTITVLYCILNWRFGFNVGWLCIKWKSACAVLQPKLWHCQWRSYWPKWSSGCAILFSARYQPTLLHVILCAHVHGHSTVAVPNQFIHHRSCITPLGSDSVSTYVYM